MIKVSVLLRYQIGPGYLYKDKIFAYILFSEMLCVHFPILNDFFPHLIPAKTYILD